MVFIRGVPKDFKLFLSSRSVFTFAVEMQGLVLGWQMYVLTRNPLYLGFIGLAEALPAIGFAPYAGYLVDQKNPLRCYQGVLALSLVSALIMFLGHDQVTLLFVSSFFTGVARAFSQPSTFALVPAIVKRSDLSRSSTWMSTAGQSARIGGPAIGGLVFGIWGSKLAATFVCAFLILSVLISIFIVAPATVVRAQIKESLSEKLLSGARYVFRHPILFPSMSLDMIAVLFGGVTALLPIYAAEILFVGPKELGILRASPALGAVIGGLLLTQTEFKKRAGLWLFGSVASFGICILVFALSRNFYLSLVALIISGGVDGVSMIIRTAAVQLSSPNHMRGRIAAINSMFIGSSNEIGEFESGMAARFLGTVPAAVFGGVVCLLTAGAMLCVAPNLRRLNLIELDKIEPS